MPHPSILIVDDEPSTRLIVRTALEEDGFELREAGDVESAWASALEAPPDLVLCDYEMPGEDGFELVRRIRADERLKSTPVIMLTAHNQIRRALEGIAVGTSDYIVKPFDPEDLRTRVLFQLSKGHGDQSIVFPRRRGLRPRVTARSVSTSRGRRAPTRPLSPDAARSSTQGSLTSPIKSAPVRCGKVRAASVRSAPASSNARTTTWAAPIAPGSARARMRTVSMR